MSRVEGEYKQMLEALITSRAVVLSLLNQLGMNHYKEDDLKRLVRQCALDLVARKPVIRTALRSDLRQSRVRHKESKPLPPKSKAAVSRG
jgi:hypothetical protein